MRRPASGSARVLRGGSWNNNDRDNLLSSNRNNNNPGNRNNNNGFRCVLVVAGGKALRPGKGRRDARRGRKPCRAGAKKEPNPGGFPPEKTDKRVGRARCGVPGAGNPRGAKAPPPPGKRRGARPWSRPARDHGMSSRLPHCAMGVQPVAIAIQTTGILLLVSVENKLVACRSLQPNGPVTVRAVVRWP